MTALVSSPDTAIAPRQSAIVGQPQDRFLTGDMAPRKAANDDDALPHGNSLLVSRRRRHKRLLSRA